MNMLSYMKYILFFLLMVFSSAAFPQKKGKIKQIQAEYTYYAPSNVSIDEARRIALERAKVQALADAFGTIVSQTDISRVKSTNEEENVDYMSIGGTDVKGEWIEDIGEPVFNISFADGTLVVKVSVKGNAREIKRTKIDIQANVLCNGTEERHRNRNFRSGDEMYLSFCSPVDGYLAVYLTDYTTAYCLLPYRQQTNGIYKIEANKQYVFFNQATVSAKEKPIVDEYTMICSDDSERNVLYLLFSPNPFTKAVDHNKSETLPRVLTYEKFKKWEENVKKLDSELQSLDYTIQITK